MPSLNEIVEEMIQRAEHSQASQSSLVPETELGFQDHKVGELDKLLAPVKSTAKKQVPSDKELAQHELEGNAIIC